MTTARAIIEDSLTFGLNRRSPGESADADTLAVCLRALNSIADEMNGGKSFLFREILTASGSAISAATALLGTAWTSLSPGDKILGASYADSGDDTMLRELTIEQYQGISDKTATGQPEYWAHDGLATVYFYPVPTSYVITLRTHAIVSDFADVDTDYSMPKGYKSALSALLAQKLAPVMIGGVTPAIANDARAARIRMSGQAMRPAILNGGSLRANILQG